LDAKSLLSYIKELLNQCGVDTQKCFAQTYDGASVMSGRVKGVQKLFPDEVPRAKQCGNFNWNKIHNLDIGDFCKTSRNRSIFIFHYSHFGAYGFCISAPGSAQPPLTFFLM
jgi:hypothetical protein